MNESSESASSTAAAPSAGTTLQPPCHSRQLRFLAALRSRRALVAVAALAALSVALWSLGRQYWASRHYRAAQVAFDRHHYDRAKAHVEIAYAHWPDDPAILLLGARIARRTQKFDHAEALLDRYLTNRGEDDDLILERVLLRAERGNVDGVREFCRRLIAQDHPHTPRILEAVSAGYLRRYRTHEAFAALNLWLEREPNSVQAHYLMGTLHEMQSQPQQAVESLRRAVELDAEHDAARFHLASNLLTLFQAREALPHLRHTLERQPRNVAALVDLGRCLDLIGDQDQAERALDEALALEPRHVGALRERGQLALRRDQPERAEAWLQRACDLAPGDYQLHYQLTLCLQRLGKDDAVRELQPRLQQYLSDATRLRSLLDGIADAPNDPNLLQELGAIALRAGALDDGLRWFEAALQADPNHQAAHESLAALFQQTGQPARAAKHRELAKKTR